MKKLITVLFAVMLTFSLSAQTDAGTFLLAGSTGLDFASQKVTDVDPDDYWDDNESKVNIMEFEVLGGYFITDGLALGLALSYESNIQTLMEDDYFSGQGSVETKTSERTLIIGPVLRYYIASSGIWGQVSYSFGSQNQKTEIDVDWPPGYYSYQDPDDEELKNKVSGLGFQFGYAIYLSDNISLNPKIGYSMMTLTVEDGFSEYVIVGYDYLGDPIWDYDEEDLKIKTSGLTFGLGLAVHF